MTAVRLVALSDSPLSVDACLTAVADPAAGGVGVFVGAVRRQDSGRGVVELEYSAHPQAEAALARVAEGVASRFAVTAVAVVHRVGLLRVGDLAVVVAASAPHRAEALDATRALIEELKATVPIWKRQVFTDGEQEWVGSP